MVSGKDCFGNTDVEGGGNLNVLAVALDHAYLLSVGFHHRGIVGEGFLIRLPVGSLQQLDVEGLGCLHQSVVRPVLVAFLNMVKCLYHGYHGDDGFCRAGRLIATADDINRHERPYSVVYTDHTLGIIRYQCQPVLYAMETGLPAISQLIALVEMVFVAELSPIVLLRLG